MSAGIILTHMRNVIIADTTRDDFVFPVSI